jgi:hypothetical protein
VGSAKLFGETRVNSLSGGESSKMAEPSSAFVADGWLVVATAPRVEWVCRAGAVSADRFCVKQLFFSAIIKCFPCGLGYGQVVDYQDHSSFRSPHDG